MRWPERLGAGSTSYHPIPGSGWTASWKATQGVLVEDGSNDDNPGVRKEQKHLSLSSMGCSDRAQVLMLRYI